MPATRASIDEPADGTATGESPQQPIRIVVVDDHQFMRELIIRMLGRPAARYTVVAEGADAKGAVAACEEFQPDLLILDINLPDESGIDAVPRLKEASPRTRILLCTAYVTDDRVIDAMRSGAHGFVEKTNTWNDFVDAVDRVGSGEHYFSSHHSGALTDIEPAERGGLTPASVVGLSGREKDVLQLIAHGNTSKEIAAKLGISVGTVETHRTNLMKKLHIRNVAGLVVFAFRAGLIRLAPR
ncbi:MAG: response regulator transcription factor [Verrucomicrobiota bacterium]|nr:response regulator transcription factor [Verrucomicrobiota bacterium]